MNISYLLGIDNNGTATPGPSKININCDIKNISSKIFI